MSFNEKTSDKKYKYNFSKNENYLFTNDEFKEFLDERNSGFDDLYKFFTKSQIHRKIKYEENKIFTDIIKFDPTSDCRPGGLYFTHKKYFNDWKIYFTFGIFKKYHTFGIFRYKYANVHPIGNVYCEKFSVPKKMFLKCKSHSLKINKIKRRIYLYNNKQKN